jgi:phosphatidylglycerophosphate synthase
MRDPAPQGLRAALSPPGAIPRIGDQEVRSMSARLTTTTPERAAFRDATRIITGFLGPLEKRTLLWLAVRIPGRVSSDHLTLLALAAMLGAGLSYWLASVSAAGLVLVCVFLAVNWFGDSLDGTLARVRRHERPRYGYYVDHVVDAFGALFLLGGLALSGYMSPWLAVGLLVGYFMLSIEVYLAAHSLGRFKISYFKMGPTELRILLAIGNLALLVNPMASIFGHEYRLFDVGGAIALAGMAATLVFNAAANTFALYRQEPIPRQQHRHGDTEDTGIRSHSGTATVGVTATVRSADV